MTPTTAPRSRRGPTTAFPSERDGGPARHVRTVRSRRGAFAVRVAAVLGISLVAATPAALAAAPRAVTTVTITTDVGHSIPAGQPVHLTATVTADDGSTPPGTITFLNVGMSQCVDVPLVDGVATCTAVYRYVQKGAAITVRARYGGAPGYKHAQGQADDAWFYVGSPQMPPTVRQIAFGRAAQANPTVSSEGISGNGQEVLAFVTAGLPAGAQESSRQRVTSVTGGSADWHRVATAGGKTGVVEIWATDNPYDWRGGRVTATLALPGAPAAVTVVRVLDAQVPTSGVSASGVADAGGAAEVALTPASERSLVLAAGWAASATAVPATAAGQQVLTSFVPAAGGGVGWVQLVATAPPAATPLTAAASLTGPWQLSAVEIQTTR